ncbi:uncharacterized protein ASCRUDRAFT_70439 [Ascoidea rubescens DSM 1968]|uniref:Chromatin modification-related protein n=1 Tax=Ascoidea rubescens DSM 1968 TaxID=1344418 RepID=A0A1D2VI73_9ASCO|nr:hypothetical protein ASCRUDRAFT_70439 [Ascoidea rubescens DSM 1968]ODV61240.1 hypothetical protein ASCRUDRAFT_70439 [Ascoidea rubescens DSM 1968]
MSKSSKRNLNFMNSNSNLNLNPSLNPNLNHNVTFQDSLHKENSCPALNEIGDAIDAFPKDLIKYFTLMSEIDAKCITSQPLLNQHINGLINLPKTLSLSNNPNFFRRNANDQRILEERHLHKRWKSVDAIHFLLGEILPSLEEKMHVASVAADCVVKNIEKINQDFENIINNEIPESIRIGPLNHPAIIADLNLTNETKSAQSQKSESRREAIAARKAAQQAAQQSQSQHKNYNDPHNDDYIMNTSNVNIDTSNIIANNFNSNSRSTSKKRESINSGNSVTKKRRTNLSSKADKQNNDLLSLSRQGTPSSTSAKKKTNKNSKKTNQINQNSALGNSRGSNSKNNNNSNANGNTNSNSNNSITSNISSGNSRSKRSSTPSNSSNRKNTSSSKSSLKSENIRNTKDKKSKNDNSTSGSNVKNKNPGLIPLDDNDGNTYHEEEQTYCICQQFAYGEMIACDNTECPHGGWFHVSCLNINIDHLPNASWYCNGCKAEGFGASEGNEKLKDSALRSDS